MKKFIQFFLVSLSLLVTTATIGQTRTTTTRNIQQGEFIDLGGSSSTGDTLQVTDTVAYIIPVTHANDIFPYINWYWNKSGSGTASITMSFWQSNDPTNSTNFKAVVAGVAQTAYTKSYSLSASGWNEVSFARDTARFEGRYLKIQYVTSATANVGGKAFTRVKTVVK